MDCYSLAAAAGLANRTGSGHRHLVAAGLANRTGKQHPHPHKAVAVVVATVAAVLSAHHPNC